MAATNHERVGSALALLSAGLAPFVERECVAKYGAEWVDTLADNETGMKVSKKDAQFLLKAMWDAWNDVFRAKLSQTDRTYVIELRNIRNRWAHQETFSTDDAYRALDTTHRLLLDVSAADQAVEVDRMKQELLRTRFSEQTRQRERKRWAKDGFSYNGLVVAWPAILRISAEQSGQAVQLSLEG